jgi:hypothetical protein
VFDGNIDTAPLQKTPPFDLSSPWDAANRNQTFAGRFADADPMGAYWLGTARLVRQQRLPPLEQPHQIGGPRPAGFAGAAIRAWHLSGSVLLSA